MLARIIEEDKEAEKLKYLPKYSEFLQQAVDDSKEKIANFQKKMIQLDDQKKNTIDYCL